MKREHFVKVVEETLDLLPQEFRSRIRNVAVLVEDRVCNRTTFRGEGAVLRGWLLLFRFRNKIEVVNSSEHPNGTMGSPVAPLSGEVEPPS
jgi:hypothetical protein